MRPFRFKKGIPRRRGCPKILESGTKGKDMTHDGKKTVNLGRKKNVKKKSQNGGEKFRNKKGVCCGVTKDRPNLGEKRKRDSSRKNPGI